MDNDQAPKKRTTKPKPRAKTKAKATTSKEMDYRVWKWCLQCRADRPVVNAQPNTESIPWRYTCRECGGDCIDKPADPQRKRVAQPKAPPKPRAKTKSKAKAPPVLGIDEHYSGNMNAMGGFKAPFPTMIVCPKCGNKRCPHASNTKHQCTGSNEPGQIGTISKSIEPIPTTTRQLDGEREAGSETNRGQTDEGTPQAATEDTNAPTTQSASSVQSEIISTDNPELDAASTPKEDDGILWDGTGNPGKPWEGSRDTQTEPTEPFPTTEGSEEQAGTLEAAGTGEDSGQGVATTQLDKAEQTQNVGDVPFTVAETAVEYGSAAEKPPREAESQASATRRWRATGIADQVAVYRDRKREEYSRANPKSKRRDAHDYAWECAMAQFPPPGAEPVHIEEIIEITEKADVSVPESVKAAEAPPVDQGVPGLDCVPESWGELPDNATLQAEIAWVSANRLRVRSGTGVDLSKAKNPAPSYAALSWLETSILFPSKFADISVKATVDQDDEKEHIKREKFAIDEIRSILAEMLEAKD